MKKNIWILVVAIATLLACKNNKEASKATGSSMNDSLSRKTMSTTAEGDMVRKSGVMAVYENGQWMPLTGEIVLTDGSVVTERGIVKKEAKMIVLKEGYKINRSGVVFDHSGTVLNNIWEQAEELPDSMQEEKEKAPEQSNAPVREW